MAASQHRPGTPQGRLEYSCTRYQICNERRFTMANSQSPLLTWEKDGKWGVGVTEATVTDYPYETRKDALEAVEQFNKLGGQTPTDHVKQFNDFATKVQQEEKAAAETVSEVAPNTLRQAPLGDDGAGDVTANSLAARVATARAAGPDAIRALYDDPNFKAELKSHGLQVNGAAVKVMIEEAETKQASGQVPQGSEEAATGAEPVAAIAGTTGAAAPGAAGIPIQRTGQASVIPMDGPKTGPGAGQSGEHSPNA
jgi:hypothetical protein